MRNKLINFFYNHRIIDSHIGIWKFHIWIYLLATYFDLYLIGISIQVYKWSIMRISLGYNHKKMPQNLSFKFLIFGKGIDTDKTYNQKVKQKVNEYFEKKKQALDEFRNKLSDAEKSLIEKYDVLR